MSSIFRSKINNKKYNLPYFIFFGFNTAFGYSFLVTIGSAFMKAGNYTGLIILISALITMGSGLMFGKLSKKFKHNGGAYYYATNAYSKYVGGVCGVFQFLINPFYSAVVPLGIVWIFNGIPISGNNNVSHEIWVYVLAMVIFISVSLIPIFGFVKTNKYLNILLIVKLSVFIFLAIVALSKISEFNHNIFNNAGAVSGSIDHNHNGFSYKTVKTSFTTFIPAVFLIFFAFGGSENLSSMRNDVIHPEKNIVKATVLAPLFIGLGYIIYFYLFLGAIGSNTTNGGMAHQVFPTGGSNSGSANSLGPNIVNTLLGISSFPTPGFNNAAGPIGMIIALYLIISQIANKSSGRLQDAWETSRIISSLSRDGYFPKPLHKKNKYGQFKLAIYADLVLSSTIAIIFIVLNYFDNIMFTTILSTTALITFIVFIITGFSFFKLQKKYKKFVETKLTNFFVGATLFSLFGLVICYFSVGIINIIKIANKQLSFTPDNYGILITLFIVIIIFIVGLYVGHKKVSNSIEEKHE